MPARGASVATGDQAYDCRRETDARNSYAASSSRPFLRARVLVSDPASVVHSHVCKVIQKPSAPAVSLSGAYAPSTRRIWSS